MNEKRKQTKDTLHTFRKLKRQVRVCGHLYQSLGLFPECSCLL